VPTAPCPVTEHYLEEPGPIHLTPTNGIFININKILSQSSPLQAELSRGSRPFRIQEVLQTPHRLGGPPLGSLYKFPVLLELRSTEADTSILMWPQQGRAEGEGRLPPPAGHALCNAPTMPLVFWATRAPCWIMADPLPTRTPRSLPAEFLSNASAPHLYQRVWLFLPRRGSLHLLLLNLIGFLPTHSPLSGLTLPQGLSCFLLESAGAAMCTVLLSSPRQSITSKTSCLYNLFCP